MKKRRNGINKIIENKTQFKFHEKIIVANIERSNTDSNL